MNAAAAATAGNAQGPERSRRSAPGTAPRADGLAPGHHDPHADADQALRTFARTYGNAGPDPANYDPQRFVVGSSGTIYERRQPDGTHRQVRGSSGVTYDYDGRSFEPIRYEPQ